MKIFNFFQKSKQDENEILNSGLTLAMKFGENWLTPIQSRLSEKFKFLDSEQLDKYDSICRNTMKTYNDLMFSILEKLNQENETITETDLKKSLAELMLENHHWISDNNLSSLFNQVCYYAFKDGLDKCIK
jgi:hypothetical protein